MPSSSNIQLLPFLVDHTPNSVPIIVEEELFTSITAEYTGIFGKFPCIEVNVGLSDMALDDL